MLYLHIKQSKYAYDKPSQPWQTMPALSQSHLLPEHRDLKVFEHTELIYSAWTRLKYYHNEITFTGKEIAQC